MPGTLFVVATPIGNLEDLTFRALRTLGDVDLIAAEDTRRTSKLLAHYKIRKPLVSLRQHNEAREGQRLVQALEQGQSVALVSDAGTPGIADPGARFVRLARAHGIPVVPVPGPTAVAAALSASGLPADQFVFLGFPPASGERRREWLDDLRDQTRTVVFFEAPHRVAKLVGELRGLLVKRQILIFKEISKLNELSIESPNEAAIETLKDQIKPIGEFTVVVGAPQPEPDAHVDRSGDSKIVELFGHLIHIPGVDESVAVRMAAAGLGLKAAKIRGAVKRHAILVKQQKAEGH